MTHTRRLFLRSACPLAAGLVRPGVAWGQANAPKQIRTPELDIACWDHGPPQGFPILLLHGFPDDALAFDRVVPPLVRAGYRCLVPYLRGYGPTRFRDPAAPRMAQQAAIGQDVIHLADALKLDRFAVCGYDWGGRAAAIAAALNPGRARAAVLIGGYTVQNTLVPPRPAAPEAEYRLWYQWYFNTERGRAGLHANRHALCKLLWRLWSPGWRFADEEYDRSAVSFDNPDFVDVVIHSYRHRNFNAPGDPRLQGVEEKLAARPAIQCPAIALYGADDGIARPAAESPPAERAVLPKLLARRVVAGVGHFMPREKPEAVSEALLEALGAAG